MGKNLFMIKKINTNNTQDANFFSTDINNASYASHVRNPMLSLSNSRRMAAAHATTGQRVKKPASLRRPIKKWAEEKPSARISEARPVKLKRRIAARPSVTTTKQKIIQSRMPSEKPVTTKPRLATGGATMAKAKIGPKKIKWSKMTRDGLMRIIPLGGCEEVGRNMTVFEYIEKDQPH